jgi:hypothetical protein
MSTRLPFACLSLDALLKARYDCGPILDLDGAQRALLQGFLDLYPYEQYRVRRIAEKAGREYVVGSDLALAVAQ